MTNYEIAMLTLNLATPAILLAGVWKAARWTQRVDSELARNTEEHGRFRERLGKVFEALEGRG